MATSTRERRPSTGAPISELQGPVGPAGVTRPKHRRTFTGFGAGEIKSVEGMICFFNSAADVFLVFSFRPLTEIHANHLLCRYSIDS
jgi:hypothetical protein